MRIIATIIAAMIMPSAFAATSVQPGPTREASATVEDSGLRPVAVVIEEYVKAGFASNLALQSADLEVERSEAALDAARGRFFP